MLKKLLNMIKKNKEFIIGIIIVIAIVSYINRDRIQKAGVLRKLYREEYDNYDLSHNIPTAFQKEYADAGVDTYNPTKTSELVAYCDEKREECVEY